MQPPAARSTQPGIFGGVPVSGPPLEQKDAVALASMLDIFEAAVRDYVLERLVIANMKRRLAWAGVLPEESEDHALAAGLFRGRVRAAHHSWGPFDQPRLSYGAESILAIGENSVEYLDEHCQQRTIDFRLTSKGT